MQSQINYDQIKADISNILRDDDDQYHQEVASGLKAAVRRLREESVLDSQRYFTVILPAGSNEVKFDEMGLGIPEYLDCAYTAKGSHLWHRMHKVPFKGADLRQRDDSQGMPTCWAVDGVTIFLDKAPAKDITLRLWCSAAMLGCCELPPLSHKFYDFLLQYSVMYVQMNFLNLNSDNAASQAVRALETLINAKDKAMSSGEIQPFTY